MREGNYSSDVVGHDMEDMIDSLTRLRFNKISRDSRSMLLIVKGSV